MDFYINNMIFIFLPNCSMSLPDRLFRYGTTGTKRFDKSFSYVFL